MLIKILLLNKKKQSNNTKTLTAEGQTKNTLHILTINVLVLEMWRDVWKSTLQNHLMGPVKDSKWSRHKIETF